MTSNLKHITAIFVLLFTMSYTGYGQNGPDCGPGEVNCRNQGCIPARNCGVGPPPPGLVVPIDTNIFWLVAAGLGLGVYFFASSKEKGFS